jgi:CRP/FNR family cyclic AMP-dependent transcriptional regulator
MEGATHLAEKDEETSARGARIVQQRDEVQPFRGHGIDPSVLAAWSKSFLGTVDDNSFRADLLSDAVSSTYSAGSWVREPDYQWFKDAYPITLIVEGVFRAYITNLSGRQATVQYMREGHVWGLVRTLNEGRPFHQRMMYQALLPARVLMINGSRFMNAAKRNSAVAIALSRELAQIVVERTTSLESSVFAHTSTRIAQHLNALVSDDGRELRVQLSQQEIADSVGTVREVVTRIIGQFREQGILCYQGRRLEILDRDSLAREAVVR